MKDSRPENSIRSNDSKKGKRTLGKILSAFGRTKKTATSSPSNLDVVDVPQMAPSPRVNISSVSSTPSTGERPNNQTYGRMATVGTSTELTPSKRYVSTELSEKGTQTGALSSVPSATHYRRHQLPSDASYSSYPKYNAGYPTNRASKSVMDRHHSVEMSAAAAAAAPSWRRTRSRHLSTTHMSTATSDRRRKRSSANEMDILSFFDTGSVDHGYAYKCAKEAAAASDAIHVTREGREGAIQRLTSSESQSRQQQLMLEDKDGRNVDHHYRRNHPADCQAVEEVAEDAPCVDDQQMRPTQFHLQTVKNGHQSEGGGPASFWYCEKMDKSKAKRIPDDKECEPVDCCERVFDQAKMCKQQPERLQQTRLFSRQLTTEEKRRLAKIGAIVLATAGVAALIMLLIKYKRQAQLCKSLCGDECDTKSTDTFDDDEGVCIFEKFDKVKCQNNNFKAMMSNSEKLVEHDDRVCASQNFNKITKRLKDGSDCRTSDCSRGSDCRPNNSCCSCGENECGEIINKKKCYNTC